MAAKDRREFVRDLAATHVGRPPLLLPHWRAAVWFAIVGIGTTVAMLYRQPFRPGFGHQMIDHPVLLIEMIAALALTFLGAYAALVRAVPGESVSRGWKTALWLGVILFAAGLAAEFTHFAPQSSTLGARPNCWAEVLVYGAAGTVAFVWLARRGIVRFSWLHGFGYGVAAIVPAALMQVACMYEPVHNMLFHFLPIVPVIAVGLILMKRASGRG